MDRYGYGIFQLNRKAHKAHRVAWELERGAIPPGILVCHGCDVLYPAGDVTYRRCVNPAHLFLGTAATNSADMVAKGRQAAGDRNGSRLHPGSRPRGANHPKRMRPELVLVGERCGSSKLTEAMVLGIRARHAAGSTCQALAAEFSISLTQARNIVRGLSWRHLLTG